MLDSVKGEDVDFNVEDIYTPLEVAKEEIWRRWNDKDLRKKVEQFLNNDIPEFLRKEPRAIMVRQIISPNMEFFKFLDLAKTVGLNPLASEYTCDKFVSVNPNKLGLGKLSFFNKVNKNNQPIFKNVRIIDIDNSENKRLIDIETINGCKLVDFHHKILSLSISDFQFENLIDLSTWCMANGGRADKYYYSFLLWFMCNGILFENFLLNKNEGEFTKKVVWPSIKKIQKEFGLKPLIVPIASNEEAEDVFWRCYNKDLEKHL